MINLRSIISLYALDLALWLAPAAEKESLRIAFGEHAVRLRYIDAWRDND